MLSRISAELKNEELKIIFDEIKPGNANSQSYLSFK